MAKHAPIYCDVAYIYGLECPDTGDIRYVGKAANPQKRFAAHLREWTWGKSASPKNIWIRQLSEQGKTPRLRALCVTGDWERDEPRLIKAHAGPALLNVAEGGLPKWPLGKPKGHTWHSRVIARYTNLARSADSPRRREAFREISARLRNMRKQAIKMGAERQYETYLESVFGSALGPMKSTA